MGKFKKLRKLTPNLHEVEDADGRVMLLWQGKKETMDTPEVRLRMELFGKLQGRAHIMPIWEVFDDEEHVNIVMGYGSDGPTYLLKDVPIGGEKMPEAYVRLFVQQLVYMAGMCLAMGFMDGINFETVLVKRHMLFLFVDPVGTPSIQNLPIEVLRSENSWTEARLVWVCGLFFYKLVYGQSIYEALKTFWWSMDETVGMVIRGELKPWYPACGHVEQAGITLLGRMLEMDPYKRIKLNEILENEWLMQELPGW